MCLFSGVSFLRVISTCSPLACDSQVASFEVAPFGVAPFEAPSFETASFEASSFEVASFEASSLEVASFEASSLEVASFGQLATGPLGGVSLGLGHRGIGICFGGKLLPHSVCGSRASGPSYS